MTPTLRGRIETRVLLGLVACLWTAFVVPWLPHPAPAGDATVYRVAFEALGLTTGIGVVWEVAYHGLQQFRWDKDWPSLFGLLTLLNEGALLWFVLYWTGVLPGSALATTFVPLFVSYFVSTWVLLWMFMQGPLRVVHLRWRFEGGRVLPW